MLKVHRDRYAPLNVESLITFCPESDGVIWRRLNGKKIGIRSRNRRCSNMHCIFGHKWQRFGDRDERGDADGERERSRHDQRSGTRVAEFRQRRCKIFGGWRQFWLGNSHQC